MRVLLKFGLTCKKSTRDLSQKHFSWRTTPLIKYFLISEQSKSEKSSCTIKIKYGDYTKIGIRIILSISDLLSKSAPNFNFSKFSD